MPPLNRDMLRQSRRSQTVRIEALNDDACLREMSAAERLQVLSGFRQAAREIADAHARQAKAGEGETVDGVHEQLARAERTQQRLTAQMVQLSLVDAQGERLYADDEIDAVLADLNGEVLVEISNAAMRVNGLGESAPDPKASAETTNDAGSSDSA